MLTLWTSVAIMPYRWIPPYTDPRDTTATQLPTFEYESSDSVRRRLLGPDTAVLVAVYQAYSLLPNRMLGVGRPEQKEPSAAAAEMPEEEVPAEGQMQQQLLGTAGGRAGAEGQIGSSPPPQAWNLDGSHHLNRLDRRLDDTLRRYYSHGCFSRVGSHARGVWIDMQNLLIWQEPKGGACLGAYEDELCVLQPFLLYLGAHVGTAVAANMHYLEDVITKWRAEVVSQEPRRDAEGAKKPPKKRMRAHGAQKAK